MSLSDYLKTKPILEKTIEVEILDFLNQQPKCFAYKVNRVGVWDEKAQAFRSPGKFEMKGVSDINLLLDMGKIVFLEVKTNKGKQSKDQIAFENKVKSLGFDYHVVRSVEETKEILNGYFQ